MKFLGFQLTAVLSTFSWFSYSATITPPSYPLAVRSPYLSAWLPGDKSDNTPTATATFWNGLDLTWTVAARVDNKTYSLFGYKDDLHNTTPAKQTSITYSSTHTRVSYTAGTADFILDFFSPVSPNNNLRQSLPLSYLTVTASSRQSPKIQILAGADDSWTGPFSGHATNSWGKRHDDNAGGHGSKPVQMIEHAVSASHNNKHKNIPNRGDIATNFTLQPNIRGKDHSMVRMFSSTNPKGKHFGEAEQMATWGTFVWATSPENDVEISHSCHSADEVHRAFIAQGVLSNKLPGHKCDPGAFLAYAYNLGAVSQPQSRTFAVGFDTNPTLEFTVNNRRKPYMRFWRSSISDLPAAVAHFFDDFKSAAAESFILDHRIRSAAEKAVSSDYADLVEAAVRQSYGAIELVVSSESPDAKHPLAFLKEISSNGNVNTVDVILPTFPIFWALSPQYIRYHLQPYFDYLSAHRGGREYMVHDLGSHYPNATGPPWPGETMPLQSTSSFMTLLLAYQTATNDNDWIKPYISLLQPFADFLEKYGMAAHKQLSTADFIPATAHQTGLAVQAAQGLHAFGEVSGMKNYTAAAKKLARKVFSAGVGVTNNQKHFTFTMGKNDTWNVIGSAFTEKLLGLDTFPQAAWDMQSDWYGKNMDPLGLPYVTDVNLKFSSRNCKLAISEWNFWAAAAASKDTQSKILDAQYKFFTNGLNPVPFPTRYCLDTRSRGHYKLCEARSTVGSVFAPMILNSKMKAGALGTPAVANYRRRPSR